MAYMTECHHCFRHGYRPYPLLAAGYRGESGAVQRALREQRGDPKGELLLIPAKPRDGRDAKPRGGQGMGRTYRIGDGAQEDVTSSESKARWVSLTSCDRRASFIEGVRREKD